MAKTKQRQPQKTGLRAVTYSRVSNPSQAEDDKTSLSEQDADMEALGGHLGVKGGGKVDHLDGLTA